LVVTLSGDLGAAAWVGDGQGVQRSGPAGGASSQPGGDLAWSVPSDELFQWWSDRVGATGLALYGRKLWETTSSHWPTADQQPGAMPAETEFARRWRDMPKVMFSSMTSAEGEQACGFGLDVVGLDVEVEAGCVIDCLGVAPVAFPPCRSAVVAQDSLLCGRDHRPAPESRSGRVGGSRTRGSRPARACLPA
jgi:hypothetical protein